jgi:hypothetical protein
MRSNTGRAALLVMALSCGCGEPVRAPSPPADASPLDATPPDASPLDVGEDRAPPRDASLSRDAADDLTDAAPDAAPSDRPAVDVAADVTAADAASDAHADGGDDVVDAPPVDAPPPPIEVIITADNAYSFGFGTGASIVTYVQGSRATTAGQIFNCPVGVGPEAYTIPSDAVPSTSHVYIVSWDDLSVTQGVLGQFGRGGRRLYTGDAAWQVCATGIDLARSATGPTQAEVNAQITRCNEGAGAAGTTSQGWVNTLGAVTPGAAGTIAIGELNDTLGGTFPQVCPASFGGIDAAARWIWYQPGGVADPFRSTGSNTFRAYLIFRLAVLQIPL